MTKKEKKTIVEMITNYPERTEQDRITDYKNYFEKIINYPKYPLNSCAFIGETTIDKIQLTRDIFHSYGFEEWNSKNGDFVLIDSEKKFKSYKIMLDYIEKYKDIRFVVITKCANILRNDAKILVFKYLNEFEREINSFGKKIRVSAHYILLSDTDSRDKLKNPVYGEALKQRVEWIY